MNSRGKSRTHLVNLGLGNDGGSHRTKHGEEALRAKHELLLLGSRDHVANVVLDRAGDLVELVVAGLLGTFGLFVLGFATFEIALDEFEMDELFDGAVSGDEDELRQVERVSESRLGLGRLLLLVLGRCHRSVAFRIVLRLDRLDRLGLGDRSAVFFFLGSRSKDSDRHLAEDIRAERVRLIAERVDRVDGLLGHAEPLFARRRGLDRFGESSKDRTVHRQADLDVTERACWQFSRGSVSLLSRGSSRKFAEFLPLTFLTLPPTRPRAMQVYLARTRSARPKWPRPIRSRVSTWSATTSGFVWANMPRTMMAPRRWKRGISLLVPAQEERVW